MIELTDSPCQSSQGLYASGPATCRSKIRIPRCFTKQRTRIFSGGILRLHSVHASSCRLSFAHSQSSLSPCPLMCIKTSTLSMSTPNSAIHADLAQEARKAGDLERYVSRAALIFARTHAAPPSRLHFSHSSSVIRIGRAFINSPVFAIGLRPWPRPAPPRVFLSMRPDVLPKVILVINRAVYVKPLKVGHCSVPKFGLRSFNRHH